MQIGLTPFHTGEIEVQLRAGVQQRGAPIRNFMPDQHRDFFAMLPFVAVATNDPGGWPVATLLAGAPGFITSPDAQHLTIASLPDPIDPIAPLLVAGAPFGVLGIDLATRRRNRANGRIVARDDAALQVEVTQSFGNCPQYIQGRVVHGVREMQAGVLERLPQLDHAALTQLERADTFFVATSTAMRTGHAFGVDVSHRGGRPGFVRVDDASGHAVLTIPDFRGNRYFNTLGNLMLEPRAALLFVDFERGDLLHVQGTTEIIWDGAEVRRFHGAERLWRVRVERAWRRRNALPLRWDFRDFSPATMGTGGWHDGP
ncbi:MAG: pyridoxamine 5-phosphate oxidase [Rhodospirillales bacterium]|nr:pyridoxamine 5-phosphate oxidase [Rhodospirillales bacterium]